MKPRRVDFIIWQHLCDLEADGIALAAGLTEREIAQQRREVSALKARIVHSRKG